MISTRCGIPLITRFKKEVSVQVLTSEWNFSVPLSYFEIKHLMSGHHRARPVLCPVPQAQTMQDC